MVLTGFRGGLEVRGGVSVLLDRFSWLSTRAPMSTISSLPPEFSTSAAQSIALELFDLQVDAEPLPSYIDQNFALKAEAGLCYVLKIANRDEQRATLEFQNAMMQRLTANIQGASPELLPSTEGRAIETVSDDAGHEHFVRLVTFLPGSILRGQTDLGIETWQSLGDLLGRVDRAFSDLEHEAAHHDLRWDLQRATWTLGHPFADLERRALVERAQLQFLGQVHRRLDALPRSIIHNDANEQNLVIDDTQVPVRISGIFDFGDAVHSCRIFELAIAATYALMLDDSEPIAVLGPLVRAYHSHLPLQQDEIECLFASIQMRLVVSVTVAAITAADDPDNLYAQSSDACAWRLLERLDSIDPAPITDHLLRLCGHLDSLSKAPDKARSLDLRKRHLGPSLSLSYGDPLEIIRGRGSYLFDKAGRAHLDCVNNVCHVGHCHPQVVAAAQSQIAELNTNTRYLHDNITHFAERLAGLFPDPLSVCFFVNSGSEANELAVRMARHYTKRHGMVTLAGGYHGNTSTLIDLSPYKHDGPGGQGAPEWLHRVDCPDTYRGCFRDQNAARDYAQQVDLACADDDIAAFLVEPLIGCGGQIVPPDGYLQQAFEHARAHGSLCIADEVQIGFGRVGTHWWAFERDGVIPDIVTMGKPIGNGHPLAAVITTPEIAASFDNGMEYFNTFGGNPVSCAIGLAVLEVIESEDLRANAQAVGEHFTQGLRELADYHDCIGDVRGTGLYLGAEFVSDRSTRSPDAKRLERVIEFARQSGVLLSSDGPDHNVLKIKPPMVFSHSDASLALRILDRALCQTPRVV